MEKGETIRLLMQRNGLRDAGYVGDTEGDERACHVAGIPFIHAAYGFGTAVTPDAVIQDIEELPACLKDIEKHAENKGE